MDNHAEKLYFAKGYLAGLIDGEGTVSFSVYKKKVQPYLQIVNTDVKIMDSTVEMAKLLDLPFHVNITKRQTVNLKPPIIMSIHGLKRVKKWLQIVPLIGKKLQGELIKQFIESRETILALHPRWKPYSEQEVAWLNEVRLLNHNRGKSRYVLKFINYDDHRIKQRQWRWVKIQELIAKGWTQQKIAKFLGLKHQASVSRWLKRNTKFSTTTMGTTLEKVEGIV